MTLPIFLHFHPKDHLILDFGNTLFFHDFDWAQLQTILENYVQSFTHNHSIFKTQSINQICNDLAHTYGPEVKEHLDQLWSEFELAHADNLKPNQALLNFITANQHSYRYSVWSSNSLPLIETTFQIYNLRSLFSRIISRNDVYHLKPNPEGFEKINQQNLNLKQYLFIGDSPEDEAAAKNCSIDFIAVDDLGI